MDAKTFTVKTFNTAGPCDPLRHYMLPPEARLATVDELIAQAGYFMLHAPRQAGKTTFVRALAERLNATGKWAALWVSCEGAQAAGDDAALAVTTVAETIAERARSLPAELRPPPLADLEATGHLTLLYAYLHRWAERSPLPIYREVIPRSLSEVIEASLPISRPEFVGPGGRLRWEKLLDGFVGFWRENAESFLDKAPYSEAAAQLVFMAYLHKVVNGGGFIDREYAVGRGRIDLCLRWPHRHGIERFAVELKVRRAADVLPAGLDQIADYLERLGLEEGTLIVFDARPGLPALPARIHRERLVHRGRIIEVRIL